MSSDQGNRVGAGRRRVLLALLTVLAVLVVAGAVAAVLVLRSPDRDPDRDGSAGDRPGQGTQGKDSRSDDPVGASSRPDRDRDWSAEGPAVARSVESAAARPEQVLAQSALDDVGPDLREVLPAGTTIEVVDGSWAPDGFGGGTVVADVTYPGRAPRTYLVVVQQEDGAWKILSTVPVSR